MNFAKNKLVIVFLSFIILNNVNSQCLNIKYKVLPALPEIGLKYFADNNVERPYSYYTLETNGVNSIYKYFDSHPSGSISNIFNNYYFKNNNLYEIQIVDLSSPDTIGTKFSALTTNMWKLYPDTFVVKNLKCFKAKLLNKNENVVAYYAIDIPINDGPEKYNNLPGLIVKLETVSSIIEMVAITKNENCDILIPEEINIKYISEKNWEKYLLSGINSFIKN